MIFFVRWKTVPYFLSQESQSKHNTGWETVEVSGIIPDSPQSLKKGVEEAMSIAMAKVWKEKFPKEAKTFIVPTDILTE